MTSEFPHTPFQGATEGGPANLEADIVGGSVGEPFQGYVVTWDANERGPLSPEEFGTVKKMLGGVGLRLTELGLPATAEQEPEPVPANRDDFLAFAREHGYTERRAGLAWGVVGYTATDIDRGDPIYTRFAPVRFLRGGIHRDSFVDLRTVYDRLVDSNLRADAWAHGREGNVTFLVDLVNTLVQPDELLPANIE
jgi:hypothetical protein